MFSQVHKGVAKCAEATNPTQPLSKEEYVDDLAMTSMVMAGLLAYTQRALGTPRWKAGEGDAAAGEGYGGETGFDQSQSKTLMGHLA